MVFPMVGWLLVLGGLVYITLDSIMSVAHGVYHSYEATMEQLRGKIGETRFRKLRLRVAVWSSVLFTVVMTLLTALYMFVALSFWAAKGKIMLEFWPDLGIAAAVLISLCVSLCRKRDNRMYGDQSGRTLLPRVVGVWLVALWAMDFDFSWWTDYVLYPLLGPTFRTLVWDPSPHDVYVPFKWDAANMGFVAIVLLFLVLSCRYVLRNSFEYFRFGRGNVISVFNANRRKGFLCILLLLSLDTEKIAYRSAIPEESPAFQLSNVMALLTPIENVVYQFVGLMVLLILLKECGQICASIRSNLQAVQGSSEIADHGMSTVSVVAESA